MVALCTSLTKNFCLIRSPAVMTAGIASGKTEDRTQYQLLDLIYTLTCNAHSARYFSNCFCVEL